MGMGRSEAEHAGPREGPQRGAGRTREQAHGDVHELLDDVQAVGDRSRRLFVRHADDVEPFFREALEHHGAVALRVKVLQLEALVAAGLVQGAEPPQHRKGGRLLRMAPEQQRHGVGVQHRNPLCRHGPRGFSARRGGIPLGIRV